jgi:hypothetical protein
MARAVGSVASLGRFSAEMRFFGAMRIPLQRGRDFTLEDGVGSESVAIVSETLEALWPGVDP